MKKKRIAIINQRYGEEVNGGSEYYTRMLAEHLNPYYDIEILTTCALDYDTWKDYYKEGKDTINGVNIRRFKVKRERNIKRFILVNDIRRRLGKAGQLLERWWLKEQGPYCTELIHYIEKHQEDYDYFIFVTYLYYLSVKGLPKVEEKSILIPTAHDEPYIYMKLYKKIFFNAKALIYLTEEEKNFVESKFNIKNKISRIITTGIQVPKEIDGNKFKIKYNIQGDYIVYVGRIDIGKNCDKMFELYSKYKVFSKKAMKLVLIGKQMMQIPEDEDIISVGFVSEEDKYDGIAGARGLLIPSEYESLSLVTLEAMVLSVPVVANKQCEVLRGHCEKSSAGICYGREEEFISALNILETDNNKYIDLKKNGKKYVDNYYCWDKTVQEFQQLLNNIEKG